MAQQLHLPCVKIWCGILDRLSENRNEKVWGQGRCCWTWMFWFSNFMSQSWTSKTQSLLYLLNFKPDL